MTIHTQSEQNMLTLMPVLLLGR